MIAALNTDPQAAPAEILKKVHDEVDKFVGSAIQFDDLTMLCVRLNSDKSNEAAKTK